LRWGGVARGEVARGGVGWVEVGWVEVGFGEVEEFGSGWSPEEGRGRAGVGWEAERLERATWRGRGTWKGLA